MSGLQVINCWLPGSGITLENGQNQTLVRRITSAYAGSPIVWNDEVYDAEGMFSASDDELIVPSALNGSLLRFISNQQINLDDYMSDFQRGGAVENGFPQKQNTASGDHGTETRNLGTAARLVATADLISVRSRYWNGSSFANGTINSSTGQSWLYAEELDANTPRVLVVKTATQAISADTFTNIIWGTDDANAQANTVENVGGCFTVHSDHIEIIKTGWYRINAAIRSPSDTTRRNCNMQLYISSGNLGQLNESSAAIPFRAMAAFSAPLYLPAGATVYLQMRQVGAGLTLEALGCNYLAIEMVPGDVDRVLCQKSAGQSYPTAYASADIQWDGTNLYGSTALHDPASNNTRMICPSGRTQGRITCNVAVDLGGGNAAQFGVNINGASPSSGQAFVTAGYMQATTGRTTALNLISPWYEMNPGDYFTIPANFSNGSVTLAQNNALWCCAEFR